MLKKLCAALLSAGMILAIAGGCNSSPAASSTSPVSVAEGEDPVDAVIAQRKESGQYPKIVMSAYNWTGTPAGIDRINKLMSDYTKEKLGIEYELLWLDAASYQQSIRMMLTSGEKLDLYQVLLLGIPPLSVTVSVTIWKPMTSSRLTAKEFWKVLMSMSSTLSALVVNSMVSRISATLPFTLHAS